MTGNAAICKEIVLPYKMAEKPNGEANSQSSQLDEEELQKLGGDGGNNARSSSMAGHDCISDDCFSLISQSGNK